jgi:hypothetical protein
MMLNITAEHQRLHTLRAMRAAGLDVPTIWMRYFELSGDTDEIDVDAYLHGVTCLSVLDRDLISHAVNELINEKPRPTAPYSSDPNT